MGFILLFHVCSGLPFLSLSFKRYESGHARGSNPSKHEVGSEKEERDGGMCPAAEEVARTCAGVLVGDLMRKREMCEERERADMEIGGDGGRG